MPELSKIVTKIYKDWGENQNLPGRGISIPEEYVRKRFKNLWLAPGSRR